MKEHTLRLLGEVIAPLLNGDDLRARVDTAVTLAVENGRLPSEVEAALNGLLEEATEARLREVQRAVVRSGLWRIGADRFVALVARLTMDEHLKLSDAAQALAELPQTERSHLPQAAQHLLHVADSVVEDAREGVMEIDGDEIFRDALRALDSSRAT